MWAVSVIRYSAGILEWSNKELKAMDVKTRKILTMHGAFHLSSSVDRLYMARKDRGRGLIGVRDCVKEEEMLLNEYIISSKEWRLKEAGQNVKVGETNKVEYKRRTDTEKKERITGKRLHEKFLADFKCVTNSRSWQ